MYAPHFAAALAIKSTVPRAPLAALLAGAFLPDLLWIALARIGWLRHLLCDAQPAPAELMAQVRQLAERLHIKRCPEVWLVAAPVPPPA